MIYSYCHPFGKDGKLKSALYAHDLERMIELFPVSYIVVSSDNRRDLVGIWKIKKLKF